MESVPKAARRIGELKKGIAALGTPNIGAIEEYERVNTRYTYLTDQRDDVEKAKELLEGGYEGSIQEVAAQVGYDDAYHFSKLFKKRYGVSPSQARRNARA